MWTRMSCSWCHASNDVTGPGPHHCGECGHRADVARMDCDCPACVRGRRDVREVLRELGRAANRPTGPRLYRG